MAITLSHKTIESTATPLCSSRACLQNVTFEEIYSEVEKKKQHSMGQQDDFVKIGAVVGAANQRRAISKNEVPLVTGYSDKTR